jgi:hypothetical protein
MANSPSIVRFVAVFFLLMTAAEVFGCDLLPSPACELSSPTGSSSSAPASSQDECFCCCHHVEFGVLHTTLTPFETVEAVVALAQTPAPTVYVADIDQPPRA